MTQRRKPTPEPTPRPTFQTQLFASYDAWREAGNPVGGVFPVDQDRRQEEWPARYATADAYYVALPTGQLWCPWKKAYSTEKGYNGEGWDMSGTPEKLTAWPSIRVDGWHGYLTDGLLHEALEK